MKLWSCLLLICLGLIVGNICPADLSAEQVEQPIQISHMLGQISQEEQNFRIQKVITLGVDGYYEWLRNDNRATGRTASNDNTI